MNLLIDTSAILLRPISNVFTHRAPRPRAIYEAIRMFASESFCHVAAPAHRPMSFKQFRKFLRRHIAPLNGSVVRTPERRPMIVPIQMLNRLLAISFSIWLRHSCPQCSCSGQHEHSSSRRCNGPPLAESLAAFLAFT